MELEVVEREDGLTQVALIGKLDVTGLHAVDVKFHALTAGRGRDTIVDLRGLDFVASLGMGLFVSSAQSLKRKGARLVLAGAHGDVAAALTRAGIDQAIPLVVDVAAAEAALAAP